MVAGCTGSVLDEETEGLASEMQAATTPVTARVSAGGSHSLVLLENGSVWAWGQNSSGQLGDDTNTNKSSPVRVMGLPPAKAIAAGAAHSLALGADGKAWAWGQNIYGQLGDNSTTGRTRATPVVSATVDPLPVFQAVAAGASHSLALDTGGRVWAWGRNTYGQIGGTATTNRLAPGLVAGLPKIKSVAAGAQHSLALGADGTVWAWGQGTSGQLGDGSAIDRATPVHVSGLPPIQAIAAGVSHSLALDLSGKVWVWGLNSTGQLGDGTTTRKQTPGRLESLSAVTSIAAGYYFSLAILADGSAQAWGQNVFGQLGNGSTTTSLVPVPVQGLADAKAVAGGSQHSVALRPGCPVWSWGQNSQGQLGNGTTTNSSMMVQTLLFNTFYFDGDGDGFGDEGISEQACTPSNGFVEKLDCDDLDHSIHPGAQERCNGIDDNCDAAVDENNPGSGLACQTGNQGVCAAGITDCRSGTLVCVQSHAPTAEQCDGNDNDCDGTVDEGNPGGAQACSTGLKGVCAAGVTYCFGGNLHCAQTTPESSEICDQLDNDCDGSADDGLTFQAWYRDQDGDGYGNASQAVSDCRQPAGYVANAWDCHDANAAIRPGASEVCDGVDNNCNGQAEEGLTFYTWYPDADWDGYGNAGQPMSACAQPAGYVSNAADCADWNAAIRPGVAEACDGADNNCNGQVDEGVKPTWYRDADADAYGKESQSTLSCTKPSGYVSNSRDCNDGNAAIKPGAVEVCDGVDNNCSGQVDEGFAQQWWYVDADADSFGSSQLVFGCKTSKRAPRAGDCNDSNGAIHPYHAETCYDGIDSNCDGQDCYPPNPENPCFGGSSRKGDASTVSDPSNICN
jgi:alpha-tubulin suppressor-like RCC1 family protein